MADMLVFLWRFGLNSDHLCVKVYLELLKHVVSDLKLDQMTQVIRGEEWRRGDGEGK